MRSADEGRREPGLAATARDGVERARLGVLRALAARGYQFTTPAPSTHRRVLLRRGRVEARTLTDVFGWNLPFRRGVVGSELLALMGEADMLDHQSDGLVSRLRVASYRDLLFLHSGFPPHKEAVFFGPDSYRFADFIRAEQQPLPPGAAILDMGAGSGVGGVVAAGLAEASRLILCDVNPLALRLGAENAAFAGIAAELHQARDMDQIPGPFDLIVANPPYVQGDDEPTYAKGGGDHGEAISVQWTSQAMERLTPGGRLLLYTGSAMVRGRDRLRDELERLCAENGCDLSYRELDPDVFPGLLLKPAYWKVERIAAVGAVVTKRA